MKGSLSILSFAGVGLAGLIVDSAVLMALHAALGLYVGRMISFVAAVYTTWALNRRFTFAHRQSGTSKTREFGRYFVAMLGGGSINLAVYAGLVAFVPVVARWPVLGVAAGSVAGLSVNFTLARWFVFAQPADPVHEEDSAA